MSKPNYQIKKMTRHDLDVAISWADKEGWNPGLYDAEAFYATDPNGFFMGFLDNEPIASISAVSYGNGFGFMGFYIVRPEYRNQRFGIQIWNAAMNYLKNHTVGLDGVLAQQENYKKSGFTLTYRNIRFEGINEKRKTSTKQKLIKLVDVPFEQLLEYDHLHFPADRTQFLKLWITQPESFGIGILENNKVSGYGLIRKCMTGYKIGPLFADTSDLAEVLFITLQNFIPVNTPFFLDVPEVNKKAISLARKYDMKPMFETARMYTKEPAKLPLDHVFGVTTFELG